MNTQPRSEGFSTPLPGSGLATVLQIEATLREAENLEQVLFVSVNEFQRAVPHAIAVAWLQSGRDARVAAVTAVADVDANGEIAQAVRRLVKEHLIGAETDQLHELTPSQAASWPPRMPQQALCLPLGRAERRLGGLILFRDAPWLPAEAILATHLADATAFSAARFAGNRRSRLARAGWRIWALAAAALALLGIVPVSQSALAPAEIVALGPHVIAAPYGGVIKDILVSPNAAVKAGQPMFRLDDTEIRGKYEIATRELEVANAELLAARQRAFGDSKSKTEAAVLERRIDLRRAEIAYYSELLARLTVTAGSDGVVLMGDPDEWAGKPVKVGEKVMTLARPNETQLQAWVPVDDAIALSVGAPIRFFMNVDPLQPIEASLQQTAYEAEMSPGEILSYRVRGRFAEGDRPRARLGLKGTAKITGARVSLFYYVMRRPLAVLRRSLGL
jgi:multidrug efflux pump subunit AcrA (membrane-fusion protein)